MFFYRREHNLVAEEHKDPIGAVFFLGGLGGCLAAAHYIFFIIGENDNLKIIEWLASGWCYAGVLSIGLFRSLQYLCKKNNDLNTFQKRIQFILLIIIVIPFILSSAAVIGAVPLAFIDFMGGDLVGTKGNLGDFFNVLGTGFLIGICFGISFSFFLSIGIAFKIISRKWFLLSASLGGGIVGGLVIWLSADIFNVHFVWYSALYGILLGVVLIIFRVSNKKN